MRVIHDLPYRPKKGKFCNIAERLVNIGPGVSQMTIAKMKGKRPDTAQLLALAPLQDSVADARDVLRLGRTVN